jgi:hypothetical protein
MQPGYIYAVNVFHGRRCSVDGCLDRCHCVYRGVAIRRGVNALSEADGSQRGSGICGNRRRALIGNARASKTGLNAT